MVIVLKADVRSDSPELTQLVALAESFPGVTTRVHVVQGATRALTEIYLLGPTHAMPTKPFEEFAARREGRSASASATAPSAATTGSRGARLRVQRRALQPGHASTSSPACAPSTRARTSRRCSAPCSDAGIITTRAGAYKPRTSPYDFQGHGKACLPYRVRAGRQVRHQGHRHGDHPRVAHRRDPRRARAPPATPTGVMLQIGTRNAQNFELLKAVGAQHEFPVLFKRGMGITLDESLNACEYVAIGRQPPHRLLPARHEDQPRRSAPQLRRLRARAGGASA